MHSRNLIISCAHRGSCRALFLEGGIQMFIGQVILAGVLGAEFHKYGNALPKSVAAGAVAVICFYVAAFAWSWCAAWPYFHFQLRSFLPPCRAKLDQ